MQVQILECYQVPHLWMKRESGVNPERARRCNPAFDKGLTNQVKGTCSALSTTALLKAGRS